MKIPSEFLTGRKCSITSLINFTAVMVKADGETFRSVQKRVRSRVRDHQRKGNISLAEKLAPYEFFAWAREIKGYEALQKIKNLPASLRVEIDGVQAKFAEPRITATTPPNSYGDLLAVYFITERENRSFTIENEELKVENEKLRRLLRAANKKRTETSSKLSQAGKKGGRGNEI